VIRAGRVLTGLFLLLVATAAAPVPAPQIPADARAHGSINFATQSALLDLKDSLAPQNLRGERQSKDAHWFIMTAVNQSVQPVTRILVAGEPADGALHFFPLHGRPVLRQVFGSDPDVTVEAARAYGRHAWRITIPPAASVSLAMLMENVEDHPSVQAWTEPAIISHIRQLAVFLAAVEGLIAAAVLMTAGLAFMTGHAAPRWAALTLLAIFISRLSSSGAFDAGWTTVVGGPYGLSALIAGLSLVAGLRLTDIVAPVEEFAPGARRWLNGAMLGIAVLSLLAFVGLPGATLLVEILLLIGTAAITGYLVHRGRLGVQAARVAAPSAAVFSLVATAAGVAALGGFQDNPMAPAMAGGFLAAGAVLMALAIAAGEGIAILPATRATAAAMPIAPPPIIIEPRAPVIAAEPAEPTAALLAIGASHQGVFDLDFRSDTVTLSRESAGLLGLGSSEQNLPHISWIARIHPDDREVYKQAVADYRGQAGLAFRVEFRARSESGRYPWFELRATMLGTSGRATRCLGLMADVTTRKESEAAAMDRALRDPLTGLGNRVALMEALDQRGLSHVVFALLDIDRFKSIHLSLGDEGGDAVLAAIAQRLSKRFQGRAEVFRVGGDAFALVFAEGEADAIGEELVESCKAAINLGGRNVFAPSSIGVALGGQAEDPLDLLKNAELALIEAKRQGGGCARLYSPDLTAPQDSVTLESELRRALDEKQMDVFYQPIVRLSDATVAGFEALLRWHHPTRGLVVPGEFIAHSEATGLIVALGRFALERAAQDLAQWQRFFPIEPPLFVSVNLSRRQLSDSALESDFGRVLGAGNVRAGTLKLEVTESAIATHDDAKAILGRLRAAGAGLAIDDFGTGLSTLSQLSDVPFDTIKIDKSFLSSRLGENGDGAVVLGSIIKLAQELGRSVVVEGVEREADANWLADMGCEFGQGYFFSMPLPAADALAFIARHYRMDAPDREGVEATVSGATGVDGQA
jgi:diguanylate cyclase (GGDEF)-like protein/PAS domain S-box-containing protein